MSTSSTGSWNTPGADPQPGTTSDGTSAYGSTSSTSSTSSTVGDTTSGYDRGATTAYPTSTDRAVDTDGDGRADRVDTGPKLVTDRFLGSFGLFVLRLTVAAVLGVHGWQKVSDLDAAKSFFDQAGVFAPHAMATVTAIGELAAAVALVLGLAVRLAGLGTAVIAIGALVYVQWKGGVFTSDPLTMKGETELLLAGAGLALLGLGGGAWGVDRWFRGRNKRGMAAIRS